MILIFFSNRKSARLKPEEEIRLFLLIRDKDIDQVSKEFDELYKSVSKGLMGILYRQFSWCIPPKSIKDLEDSFQNGWLNILAKRTSFDPAKANLSVFKWMVTIMINTTKSDFGIKSESQHPKSKSLNRYVPPYKESIDITKYGIHSHCTRILEILDEAIEEELTPRQKEIFVMKQMEGLNYKEICDKLGIEKTAVYTHINNAKEKVKKYFEKNGIEL